MVQSTLHRSGPKQAPVEPRRAATVRRATVRRAPAALLALVAIGAGFRLWALGVNRLGYDEAFTAVAGRLSIGGLFDFLRAHDSHPPLDYLIHLPLARLGADELLMRLPSAACSIAALALFAWWMRPRGFAGIVATGLFAISAFELVHGRHARMYAEMELIGVGAAVIAELWLRRPKRWHAPAISALVLVGLLTHVSMFLLGAGLLALAGRRVDREAWRWRVALGSGVIGWALLWGPSFLVQTQGGHSDWIPRTTLPRVVHEFGRLVTYQPTLHALVFVAVLAGLWVLHRVDAKLGRVWVCCVLVPTALAALSGTVAPVLLDRTFTVVSWGPFLAIGFLVAALTRRSKLLGAAVIAALLLVMVPSAVQVVATRQNPDGVLRHLERVAGPGDVLAIHPGGRLAEIEWSLGVRSGAPYRVVAVRGLEGTAGIARRAGPTSGRLWLLDWAQQPLPAPSAPRCAPDWAGAGAHVYCLRQAPAAAG